MKSLLCTVGAGTYAIPIEHVIETMRPLPITALAGAPIFVSGVAIVRGEPLPVIDAARLSGDAAIVGRAGRFVVLRVGARRVALAVGGVIGLADVAPASARELPPIFRGTTGADAIAKLGALDSQLLVVLDVLRLLPEAAAS